MRFYYCKRMMWHSHDWKETILHKINRIYNIKNFGSKCLKGIVDPSAGGIGCFFYFYPFFFFFFFSFFIHPRTAGSERGRRSYPGEWEKKIKIKWLFGWDLQVMSESQIFHFMECGGYGVVFVEKGEDHHWCCGED